MGNKEEDGGGLSLPAHASQMAKLYGETVPRFAPHESSRTAAAADGTSNFPVNTTETL